MDPVTFGVALALAAAVLLLVMYFVASARERGRDPQYLREVYLYYDPSPTKHDPQAVAAAFGAVLATTAQVAMYAAAGGGARGGGAVDDGRPVRLTPGAGGGPRHTELFATEVPLLVPVHGIWLYGPKPRRGAPNVQPFNCSAWFHPAGASPAEIRHSGRRW